MPALVLVSQCIRERSENSAAVNAVIWSDSPSRRTSSGACDGSWHLTSMYVVMSVPPRRRHSCAVYSEQKTYRPAEVHAEHLGGAHPDVGLRAVDRDRRDGEQAQQQPALAGDEQGAERHRQDARQEAVLLVPEGYQ